jgi:hypothetical protein
LTVIGTGDGTVMSGVDVFMVMSIAYCAAEDVDNLKQCGEPIFTLMKDYETGEAARKSVIGKVNLSYMRSKEMGNWFTISPAS